MRQLSTTTKYRPAVNGEFYDQYPAIVLATACSIRTYGRCVRERRTTEEKGAIQEGRPGSLGVSKITLRVILIVNYLRSIGSNSYAAKSQEVFKTQEEIERTRSCPSC